MDFYDIRDSLIETALLSRDSVFIFNSVSANTVGKYRLEGGEADSSNYHIRLLYPGTPEFNLEYNMGSVFPKRLMSFYNEQNEVVETTTMTKGFSFAFNKITLEMPGIFKIRGNESDSIYSADLNVRGVSTKAIRTYNGFVLRDHLSKLKLDSLNKSNLLQLTAEIDSSRAEQIQQEQKKQLALDSLISGNKVRFKNQILNRKKIVDEKPDDSVSLVPVRKIYFCNSKGDVLSTSRLSRGNEFVFKNLPLSEFGTFRLEGEEADTLLNYKIKIVSNDSVVKLLHFKDLQLEDGILFQRKKLNYYNKKGAWIESALVNKEGTFVFHKVNQDETGLYKLDGEGGDWTLYDIERMKGGKVVSFERFQNGTVFPRKRLRSYDKNGEIVEVVCAGRDGNFIFHKLSPDKFTSFKFDDAADSKLNYEIKIIYPSASAKTIRKEDLQTDGNYLFERRRLSFYDEKGSLVETTLLNKNGSFLFHKLNPAEKGFFKTADEMVDSVAYTINCLSDQDTVACKRIQNGKVTSVESLYCYNSQGEMLEMAVVNNAGKFVFHKLPKDEFVLFKMEGIPDSKMEYKIQIEKREAPARELYLKEMQKEGGVFYEKKLLNCYDKQGNVIETALLSKGGKFVFNKVSPDQVSCFKEDKSLADESMFQVSIVRGSDTIQHFKYKDGIVFPDRTLNFYNKDGMLVESASLNSEGKFAFHKLPYDIVGSFKFADEEGASAINNYSIDLMKDGFLLRNIRMGDMNLENGSLIPLKRLVGFDKDGVKVEVALVNREGKFVFHKLSPDQICFFKLEGEDVSRNLNYKIDIISGNHVKELKMSDMKTEQGIVYEDRKMNFYNSQGVITETSAMTKEGKFHFYKLKADAIGTFRMQGEEDSLKLYEINIHNAQAKKTLQYQNGVAFPLSFLSFYDLNGKLLETARLNASGEFKFNRLDGKEEGSFQLQGEKQDNSLRNIKIIGGTTRLSAFSDNSNHVFISNKTETASLIVDTSNSAEISLPNILFDFDNSTVRGVYQPEVQRAILYLKKDRNCKIKLSGHTDSKGNAVYNLGLSLRRVKAVAEILRKGGVESNSIILEAYGKTHPLTPDQNPDGSDYPEGRKQNRRVELQLVKK